MSEELKPCKCKGIGEPWAMAVKHLEDPDSCYEVEAIFIRCQTCGYRTLSWTKEEAIEAWNNRINEKI